ncbi:MAG TPA: transketolase C-terminal domain-containing protein, partial [Acidimicrobiales bacterium]|nr:transketolase C-terminal domain-containing protein [Acidimicrobiales bacterium]
IAAELQAGTPVVVLDPPETEPRTPERPSRRPAAITPEGGTRLSTLVGVALGAALSGARPVVELHAGARELDGNGSGEPSDADAAGGGWSIEALAAELAVPPRGPAGVAVRIVTGPPAPGPGPQLPMPASLGSLLAVPGLVVAAPATAADCYGLVRAAVRDPRHVVVLESQSLAASTGELGDEAGALPFGSAEVARHGDRLTIVAARAMRLPALDAAELLSARWAIEADVIDPRCLSPFDDDTVASSLARTARLLVVEDELLAASWGAALVARMVATRFGDLDAPPRSVATPAEAPPAGAPHASTSDAAEAIATAGRELAVW